MSAVDLNTPIRNAAEKAKERYNAISESKVKDVLRQGYETLQKIQSAVKLIWNRQSVGTLSFLGNLSSHILHIGEKIYKNNRIVKFVAAKVQLVSLFSIPFAAYNAYSYGKEMVEKKEFVQSGINFAESVGWLADSGASALRIGAEYMPLDPVAKAAAHTAIQGLVGVALGANVITLSMHALGIYKNSVDLKNLDRLGANPLFEEKFNVTADKYREKLNVDEAATKKILKDRIRSKITNHALNILAILVSTAGLGVFLAFGGGIAVGVIGAVSAVIYLTAVVYEVKAKSDFEAYFDRPVNNWKKIALVAGVITLIALPLVVVRNLI